ncbi:MAG: FliA/WhiG family RNA polymerase sigma factor [Actinomycetales bacterium]|nr:FliA/WhiG family RNA polymerase sigma factor [Actinomycetales bacterium]
MADERVATAPASAEIEPAPAPVDDLVHYAPLFDGDRELAGLWVGLKHHADPSARATLATYYVPLVRYVVSRMNLTLPAGLERGDLVGFGTLGLFDAIEKYDLELGLTFQTYAVTRIRGAILDELRSLDWVPRRLRQRMHSLDAAAETFVQEHGAEPEVADLATATGMDPHDVRGALTAYRRGYVTSLDEQLTDEEGAGDGRGFVDDAAPLPDEVYDEAESRRIMREQILELPLRERAVVALYYFEELTFSEIGRVLGVSESRACQVHGRAVRALRETASVG